MSNSGIYDPTTFDPTTLNSVTIQPLTTTGAISGFPGAYNQYDLISMDTYQGEMVAVQITVSDSDAMITGMSAAGFQEDIKKRLIHMLAENLMKNKLVEFTSQQFGHSHETIFRARIYAVPDNQVRMIRKNMP